MVNENGHLLIVDGWPCDKRRTDVSLGDDHRGTFPYRAAHGVLLVGHESANPDQ